MNENGNNISEQLVAKIESLPPMPANVLKLRRASADPNMNFDMMAPILKEDPSMCADLLKVANSALFGVAHNVDTVEEAIRYFGMRSLVEFVSAACSQKIVKKSFASIKNLSEYLDHSKQISIASVYITKALKLSTHEREVYTVTGLLHDIGRLVIFLISDQQEYFDDMLGISTNEINALIDGEKQLYGLDHAELGTMICTKWQFPDIIVQGVARHHKPLIGTDVSLNGMIIFLSEIISIKGLSDHILETAVPGDVLDHIGMTPNMLLNARDDYFMDLA
jgi:putative nucleotidyltransferase with HDIG domain